MEYVGLLPDNFMIYLEQYRKTDSNINIITDFNNGNNAHCFKLSTSIPYEIYSLGSGNSKYTTVIYREVFNSLIQKLKYNLVNNGQKLYSDKLTIIKRIYFEIVDKNVNMVCEFIEVKAIIIGNWDYKTN